MMVAIVEGQAETESVPVLLRRLLDESHAYQIGIARPIRVKRNRVVKEGEIEKAVELALRSREGTRAILVVLDADDDCPKELAPQLLARARIAAGDRAICSVVLPKCELESWFLGSIESLRGLRGISPQAEPVENPEGVRDAKGRLTEMMVRRAYVETDDQAALTQSFDIEAARARCRSFRKLHKDVCAVLTELYAEVQGDDAPPSAQT